MLIAIPAFIGYYFGKKYTFVVPVAPQVFLAQPDRQDPDYTRCRFLNGQNFCAISNKKGVFYDNICNNKWNQVTCHYFISKMKSEKPPSSHQQGDLIDEIQ